MTYRPPAIEARTSVNDPLVTGPGGSGLKSSPTWQPGDEAAPELSVAEPSPSQPC